MSLQVEFGLLDDETFEDAARRIKTERDTYKSLCASQHEVIKGYEEQEADLVEALKAFVNAWDNAPPLKIMLHLGIASELARAALDKAGVEQ